MVSSLLSMGGTMGVSFILTAVVTLIKQTQADKHQHMRDLVEMNKRAELSADAADKRGGHLVRSFIAVSVVMYFFFIPAVLYFVTLMLPVGLLCLEAHLITTGDTTMVPVIRETVTNFNTSYGHMKTNGGIIGLFTGANAKLIVDQVKGLPMLPEQLHMLSAMTGFYFGGAAAKR